MSDLASRAVDVERIALAPLFGLALVHLVNGSTAKALVVARGLRALAPAVPRYQVLLCACLLADNQADAAEPLVAELLALPAGGTSEPDGGSREITLSTQLLAALVHWHQGRASEGEAELRGYLADERLC